MTAMLSCNSWPYVVNVLWAFHPTNVLFKNFSFLFLETAMGKNVDAQNNRDSEYVRAIYK